MSSSHSYTKSPPSKVDTNDNDNVSMRDNSPSSKDLDVEDSMKATGEKTNDNKSPHTCKNRAAKEEIEFKENPFQIPPSFN